MNSLEAAFNRCAFDRLVVFAPPRALAEVKCRMSGVLSAVMLDAVAIDLTRAPHADIAARLDELDVALIKLAGLHRMMGGGLPRAMPAV